MNRHHLIAKRNELARSDRFDSANNRELDRLVETRGRRERRRAISRHFHRSDVSAAINSDRCVETNNVCVVVSAGEFARLEPRGLALSPIAALHSTLRGEQEGLTATRSEASLGEDSVVVGRVRRGRGGDVELGVVGIVGPRVAVGVGSRVREDERRMGIRVSISAITMILINIKSTKQFNIK